MTTYIFNAERLLIALSQSGRCIQVAFAIKANINVAKHFRPVDHVFDDITRHFGRQVLVALTTSALCLFQGRDLDLADTSAYESIEKTLDTHVIVIDDESRQLDDYVSRNSALKRSNWQIEASSPLKALTPIVQALPTFRVAGRLASAVQKQRHEQVIIRNKSGERRATHVRMVHRARWQEQE